MGEMADMAMTDVAQTEDMTLDYLAGDMTMGEAIAASILDEHGYYIGPLETGGPVCRNCGETELYWQQVDSKWRLFKNGIMHCCNVCPLPEHERSNKEVNT